MLGFQQFSPPSDEGGAEGRGGGREKRDKSINKAFFDYPQSPMTLKKSLPQSAMQTAADGGGPLCHFVTSPHTVGSHPRQREPNETPTFAKEPIRRAVTFRPLPFLHSLKKLIIAYYLY